MDMDDRPAPALVDGAAEDAPVTRPAMDDPINEELPDDTLPPDEP